ncbi:serine/threonine protein kinase HipA of HipAB toxin-antitoxin module [Bradyrhizobium sp. LM3.4]
MQSFRAILPSVEVADHFSMLASGSNGLQGDWPKVAMTRSADGLWYPNSMVEDGDAREFVIAKLLRSSEATDKRILEAEAGYSQVAKEFGLDVHGTDVYGDGVLVIPRFDREVGKDGLVRFGQESLISALGIAEFGVRGRHETYLRLIQDVSAEPFLDTVEYILRDMLNLAMGNPDNHWPQHRAAEVSGRYRASFSAVRLRADEDRCGRHSPGDHLGMHEDGQPGH